MSLKIGKEKTKKYKVRIKSRKKKLEYERKADEVAKQFVGKGGSVI